ncbi:hypothetical protein FGM00_08770 [Aggregatimonas sangjinii]|uniref:YD repeat-containing protein n=1 Tax=Aggregatimonas sangjinii TaxID=2583587 RepID=A0A5B7SNQ2_9FLAO|nr:hypothetical protein [Aggregatimonas sangjinii]QCX00196.1 hypothetical protein FGM00_08770 [Aggregatimonas sangjinii]
MLKIQVIFLLSFVLLLPFGGASQETTIFKVSDFDLSGKVKSCLVSTDYGKEEYRFNEDGLLTEAITRYSDADYDVTLYKYRKGELLEKRVEQYRDKRLERATSIANIFTMDTTAGNRKVTEKIITYNKELLEQNEYFYTDKKHLSKIIQTTNDGIDETSIIYHEDENTRTAEYFLNGELQQSIRTKTTMQSDTVPIKTISTKNFFDGKPSSAIEKTYIGDGKISSESTLSYDLNLEKFVNLSTVTHTYGPLGVVEKTILKEGANSETKEYLYQFDPFGNWVKQIVTPTNTYKTRKIEYFETQKILKEEE